jgi:hypothetical protein
MHPLATSRFETRYPDDLRVVERARLDRQLPERADQLLDVIEHEA